MKKIFLTFITLASVLTYANENFTVVNNNSGEAPPPPTGPNDGLGGNGGVPINDYAGILVISAIALAGFISYKKQKQLN